MVSVKVLTITLTELLRFERVDQVSLLHIDAEGSDASILLSVPFERLHVDSVFLETQHMDSGTKTAVRKHLKSHGYLVVRLVNDDFAIKVWSFKSAANWFRSLCK